MTAYLAKNDELERHFCSVGESAAFVAKTREELDVLLQESVYGVEEYKALPKKSQTFIQGFISGVVHGTARLLDERPAGVSPPGQRDPEEFEGPPGWVQALQPEATWKKHPNGGGWVSSTAYVESSANIAGKATVFGNARVYDRARVYGTARVSGNAEIFGAAHVHGRSQVGDNAQIFDAAKILGEAVIAGNAKVGGTSVVRGNAILMLDEHYDVTISERERPKSGAFMLDLPAGIAAQPKHSGVAPKQGVKPAQLKKVR